MNLNPHRPRTTPSVIGVLLHLLLNVNAFKRYVTPTTARAVMRVFALVLALSFIHAGGAKSEPGFAPPVRALAQAPIGVLAQVAGTRTDEVKTKQTAAGLTVTSEQQSVAALVGPDLCQQIGALTRVLPGTAPR